MARHATLGKKKVGKYTYWHTKAGGEDVYFGNVKTVARKDADKAFVEHRRSLHDEQPRPVQPTPKMTCWELCERYLVWSKANLSPTNYSTKKSTLGQWCNHRVTNKELFGVGEVIGDLPAFRISPLHLDEFIAARKNTRKKPKQN
ncbi:MAG: hypothetical protein MI757_19370, partial [Pirellulales bacterium]|nr:hypothetical protein [Pirellulales bacterium]